MLSARVGGSKSGIDHFFFSFFFSGVRKQTPRVKPELTRLFSLLLFLQLEANAERARRRAEEDLMSAKEGSQA